MALTHEARVQFPVAELFLIPWVMCLFAQVLVGFDYESTYLAHKRRNTVSQLNRQKKPFTFAFV